MMKKAYESDVNVGIIECRTEKDFAELGRLVFDVLIRKESERELVKTKYGIVTTRECVVHGS